MASFSSGIVLLLESYGTYMDDKLSCLGLAEKHSGPAISNCLFSWALLLLSLFLYFYLK